MLARTLLEAMLGVRRKEATANLVTSSSEPARFLLVVRSSPLEEELKNQ